jgi:hypothetical protein
MRFDSNEQLIQYANSLPPVGSPEYQAMLLESAERGIAAMESHLGEGVNDRCLVVDADPGTDGASRVPAIITRQEEVGADGEVSEQYTYRRFEPNSARVAEHVVFKRGEVPRYLQYSESSPDPKLVEMGVPLSIDQLADTISTGQPFNPDTHVVYKNKLISRKSLQWLLKRVVRSRFVRDIVDAYTEDDNAPL